MRSTVAIGVNSTCTKPLPVGLSPGDAAEQCGIGAFLLLPLMVIFSFLSGTKVGVLFQAGGVAASACVMGKADLTASCRSDLDRPDAVQQMVNMVSMGCDCPRKCSQSAKGRGCRQVFSA